MAVTSLDFQPCELEAGRKRLRVSLTRTNGSALACNSDDESFLGIFVRNAQVCSSAKTEWCTPVLSSREDAQTAAEVTNVQSCWKRTKRFVLPEIPIFVCHYETQTTHSDSCIMYPSCEEVVPSSI